MKKVMWITYPSLWQTARGGYPGMIPNIGKHLNIFKWFQHNYCKRSSLSIFESSAKYPEQWKPRQVLNAREFRMGFFIASKWPTKVSAVHRKAPSQGRSKPFARLIRIYSDIHPCQNVHECHPLIQTICKIEAWWKSLPREPFWQQLAPPHMQILSEGIFDH